MGGHTMRFEVLSASGFRTIAAMTADGRLLLAPGVTPQDLPGYQGERVRARLGRREIRVADEALLEAPR